jgi:membrane protease YdiL (CAAX protease family)
MPSRARPRLWTVFVCVGVTIAAILAAQIAAATVLVAWHIASGGSVAGMENELIELVSQPGVFLGLGFFSQGILLGIALLAGWLSPLPLRERLCLVRPKLPAHQCVTLVVGAIVPFAVGMALAVALTKWIPEDPTIAKLYEKMTTGWAIPFVLFIAIAPGFSEEMLFRGYMQSRLVQRWPVWVAILLVSAFFALVHIQPHTVVFAFPLGIWLGTMAWRCGSIWPSIICHALVNGLWNAWNLSERFGFVPERPPLLFLLGLGVVGIATFGWSVWLFVRQGPTQSTSPERLPAVNCDT